MKVFCHHGNKFTIFLFNSIFRTTPEVSSKLYYVEISEVSEKLWLFNHRRGDFLASKFWNFFSLLCLLKIKSSVQDIFDNTKDLYLCALYIPPSNLRYYSDDIFVTLQDDIMKSSGKNEDCILLVKGCEWQDSQNPGFY